MDHVGKRLSVTVLMYKISFWSNIPLIREMILFSSLVVCIFLPAHIPSSSYGRASIRPRLPILRFLIDSRVTWHQCLKSCNVLAIFAINAYNTTYEVLQRNIDCSSLSSICSYALDLSFGMLTFGFSLLSLCLLRRAR